MPSASKLILALALVVAAFAHATHAQDGEFIDYYEDLDGDNLPEDYKELYDYYNYYNENDDLDSDANSNGRSVPTDDVVEAESHHAGGGWESYGGERSYGSSAERIEAGVEDLRRYGPASAENRKSEDGDKDNEENNKSDAEWRRELVYKTYREQLEAYNKLVREEHAARYTTRGTTTTTTSTTTTTTSPLGSGNAKMDDPKVCRDNDSRCERWGLNGWCALWKSITEVYCRKTCGFCDGMTAPCTDDADVAPYCKSWKSNGDCESDYDYMYQRCPSTCGFCDDDGLKIAKRR